ncbi:MAG TPA: putative beta-lysine N-acetyltransferase [Desulfotomaculum sp.]|nr:putative beta-lysine N-acetyltransferase [Desulfotomaculum sp.]
MFATNEHNNIIKEMNRKFTVTITIDQFSKRAWVNDYTYQNPGELLHYINDTAASHGLEKIIFPVRKTHLPDLKHGFSSEGWVDGFFNGEDGCFLVAYPTPRRCQSENRRELLAQVREIIAGPHKAPATLPDGCTMLTPALKDVVELGELFTKAFATYPSPVDQPDYLAGVLGKSALFRVIKEDNQIISAAAAEIDISKGNAELTNCATLPGNRGGGLMSNLIAALEQDCLARGIYSLYSLARASSYGMNLVFYRLGYRYRGTLVNNCHISGDYENMNIWSKYAR